MSTITVKASSTYDIIIQRGALSNSGKILAPFVNNRKIFVVTDDNVYNLYADKFLNSGFEEKIHIFQFKAGEKQKNSQTVGEIYAEMAEFNLTRSDVVIALGGGVVGDITGYAAATWLRGVDFIQIPTTLLAQIDSSVGGKTGIDLPCGKNLVGVFKQPKIVICDPETLKTLPKNILADGMAEAVKYGMIKDKNLFDYINKFQINDILDNIDSVIQRCIEIKRDVVEADEFEKGERMLLNFGHTLGHAVEKLSNFQIPHGSAVALGMCLITKKYAPHLTNQLKECIIRYELPTDFSCFVENPAIDTTNFSIDKLLDVVKLDKKCSGEFINYIVCQEIGQAEIRKEKLSDFYK